MDKEYEYKTTLKNIMLNNTLYETFDELKSDFVVLIKKYNIDIESEIIFEFLLVDYLYNNINSGNYKDTVRIFQYINSLLEEENKFYDEVLKSTIVPEIKKLVRTNHIIEKYIGDRLKVMLESDSIFDYSKIKKVNSSKKASDYLCYNYSTNTLLFQEDNSFEADNNILEFKDCIKFENEDNNQFFLKKSILKKKNIKCYRLYDNLLEDYSKEYNAKVKYHYYVEIYGESYSVYTKSKVVKRKMK